VLSLSEVKSRVPSRFKFTTKTYCFLRVHLILSKDSMNAKQLVLSSAKLIRQIYFVQPM